MNDELGARVKADAAGSDAVGAVTLPSVARWSRHGLAMLRGGAWVERAGGGIFAVERWRQLSTFMPEVKLLLVEIGEHLKAFSFGRGPLRIAAAGSDA